MRTTASSSGLGKSTGTTSQRRARLSRESMCDTWVTAVAWTALSSTGQVGGQGQTRVVDCEQRLSRRGSGAAGARSAACPRGARPHRQRHRLRLPLRATASRFSARRIARRVAVTRRLGVCRVCVSLPCVPCRVSWAVGATCRAWRRRRTRRCARGGPAGDSALADSRTPRDSLASRHAWPQAKNKTICDCTVSRSKGAGSSWSTGTSASGRASGGFNH